jgi:hypothetical protein
VTWRVVSFAGFAVIGILIAAWVLISARRTNGVTLGRSVRAVTRSARLRLLFFLGWAWLGWHLFARGSGAFK